MIGNLGSRIDAIFVLFVCFVFIIFLFVSAFVWEGSYWMDYDISFFYLCRTMWTFEKDVELVSMVNAGARPDAAANYFNKTEERCISHLQVLKDNHRKYNEESKFIMSKHKTCNLCLLFPSFKTKHLMGRKHANFQSIQRKPRAALTLNTSHIGN